MVVEWIGICLTMQGTWVQSLVWEDCACLKVTKPVHHNYWTTLQRLPATATEVPVPGVCAAQQEKPPQWEAHGLAQRVVLAHCNKRKPACSNEDPAQPNRSKSILKNEITDDSSWVLLLQVKGRTPILFQKMSWPAPKYWVTNAKIPQV